MRLATGQPVANTVLAPSIARSVRDPTCANPTWADSYGTDIADRRQLHAYNYLPGWSDTLEPP